MKQPDDNSTLDLLAPGVGVVRQRGRPATGKAMSVADRQAKRRALRSGTHGTLAVELPLELLEKFREFLKFKDLTQDSVIERLVRQQLLRKR